MTSFPQLSNFLFSPRRRRGLSRVGYGVALHRVALFLPYLFVKRLSYRMVLPWCGGGVQGTRSGPA